MQKKYFLLPFTAIKKYIKNLSEKWNWGPWDFVVVFFVFSATGMSVVKSRPFVEEFIWGSLKEKPYYFLSPIVFLVLYYSVLILLGSLVGKSKFFLSMSTRPIKRIRFVFLLFLFLFKKIFFFVNNKSTQKTEKIQKKD